MVARWRPCRLRASRSGSDCSSPRCRAPAVRDFGPANDGSSSTGPTCGARRPACSAGVLCSQGRPGRIIWRRIGIQAHDSRRCTTIQELLLVLARARARGQEGTSRTHFFSHSSSRLRLAMRRRGIMRGPAPAYLPRPISERPGPIPGPAGAGVKWMMATHPSAERYWHGYGPHWMT